MFRKFVGGLYRTIQKRAYYLKNKNKLGLSWSGYKQLKKNTHRHGELMTTRLYGNTTEFTSPFWFLHSIEEIFIDEVYKFNPGRKDAVILDCGANIGLSVLYFKKISPGSRVIAFEADPNVFQLMQHNIKSFGLSNVELVNKAVWIEETTLAFDSEGSVGGHLGGEEKEMKNKIDVKTLRLRDFLDQKIDFLKIDIEGAEYAVLKDCKDKLHNVENLFIEYHVFNKEEQRLEEILSLLKQAGFRYYIKQAWANQEFPFVSKGGEYYEMQLNISCYRKPD